MHRTSSKNRSLKVQRETLRTLASSELSSAQGGTLEFSVKGNNDCPNLIERGGFEEPPGGASKPQYACPAIIDRFRGALDPYPGLFVRPAP